MHRLAMTAADANFIRKEVYQRRKFFTRAEGDLPKAKTKPMLNTGRGAAPL